MSKKSKTQPKVPLVNAYSSLSPSEEDQNQNIRRISDVDVISRINEQDGKIMTITDKLDQLFHLMSNMNAHIHKSSSSIHSGPSLQTDHEDENTDDILSLSDTEENHYTDKKNNSDHRQSNDKFSTPKTVVSTLSHPHGRQQVSPHDASASAAGIVPASPLTPSPYSSSPNPFSGEGHGNSKLPSLKEIPIGGITPDEYFEWKRKLIHNVSQMPKYNTILTAEPQESWKHFTDTYAHLSPQVLEKAYLDTHQVLSAYIHGAIPNAVEVMTTTKMKDTPSLYHLPTLLSLSAKGEFNAYGLLKFLDSHYVARSNYRLQQIMIKLAELKYHGNEDPKIFVSQYRELHSQGNQLVPCWPKYQEEWLAHDLLLKLPSQLDQVKTSIMDKGMDHPKDVHEVEEALNAWWIRKTNKMTSGSSGVGSNTPNGYRGGYKGKSNSNNSSSTPIGSANPAYHNSEKQGPSYHDKRRGRRDENQHANDDDNAQETRIGCVFITREDQSASAQEEVAASAIADEFVPGTNDILFDTGASVSITGQKHQLKEEETVDRIRITGFTGGHGIMSNKKGALRLSPKVTLNNVRYVPSCTYSLMSVGQIAKNGYSVIFNAKGAYILPPKFFPSNEHKRIEEKSILSAEKIGNLYVRTISKQVAIEKKLDENNSFTYNPKGKNGKIPRKDEAKSNVISSSSQPGASASVHVNTVSNSPSPPISKDNSNEHHSFHSDDDDC
jgi:hypothetical protein